MVVIILDIIDKDIIHITLKMDLSPKELKQYHRKAFGLVKYGFLAVIIGGTLQLGFANPLCNVLHKEPIKSEVCESNISQLGLIGGICGCLTALAGKFARTSLSNEYYHKTGDSLHS